MEGKKISNTEGAIISCLVIMANAYSVMPGSGSGSDVWISNIVAGAMAFVSAFLLSYVCDMYSDEPFYGVLEKNFKSTGAVIIGVLFLCVTLATLIVSLTVFSRFVQITALPQTPTYVLPFLIALIAALSVGGGLSSVAGTARLLAIFTIVVFFLFVIPGISRILPEALFPILRDTDKILPAAGEIYLNRFSSIFALMAVYTRMNNQKTRRKFFLTSIGCAGAAITIISVICAGCLGEEIVRLDFYPPFTVMSSHGMGGFIRHTEIFACITMTVCLFFKSAVGILFSCDMLKGIFKVPGECKVALPIAFIVSSLTQIIYSDISALRTMLVWKREAIFALALIILLPIGLFFVAKVRKKRI